MTMCKDPGQKEIQYSDELLLEFAQLSAERQELLWLGSFSSVLLCIPLSQPLSPDFRQSPYGDISAPRLRDLPFRIVSLALSVLIQHRRNICVCHIPHMFMHFIPSIDI